LGPHALDKRCQARLEFRERERVLLDGFASDESQ
jgi:hypothetical protein